jgi:hypothetical protein
VSWARSLSLLLWELWRNRTQEIEANLTNAGTIEAIEESMHAAWLEATASHSEGTTSDADPSID